MTTRKKIRVFFYIFITVAIVGVILYPKIKPLFAGNSNSPDGGNPVQQRGPQALSVQGLIITPRHLSEIINSTGTLMSDEETELSFETSGRIVDIF
jgi:membrane fusion protein, multidrug efflux system